MNRFFYSTSTFLIMSLILLNENPQAQAQEFETETLAIDFEQLHDSITPMCKDVLKNIEELRRQFTKVEGRVSSSEDDTSLHLLEAAMLGLYLSLQSEVKSINLYALSVFSVIGSNELKLERQDVASKLFELNKSIAKTISDKQNGYHDLDSEIKDYSAIIDDAKKIYESML